MTTSLKHTFLALAACVTLAACGGDAPHTPPAGTGEGGDGASASEAPLAPRTSPLAVGDVAPGLSGLDAEKKVVVFYRGSW